MLQQDDAGWSNPKVLGILAVIFLCGAAFGTAVTNTYLHKKFMPGRQYHGIEKVRRIGVKDLSRDLALTSEQERIVEKELDDYAKYYQNLQEDRDDVAALGERRIMNVLAPGQRAKFLAIYGQTEH